MIAANPDYLEARWGLCYVTFAARGSTQEVREFAQLKVDPSEHGKHLYLQGLNAGGVGDWPEVFRLDREQRYYDGDDGNPRWNQDMNVAEALAEAGDMAAARARASGALAAMKDETVRQPQNGLLWACMCLAHGILGEGDEALLCAQKSAEFLPESRDAIQGPQNSLTCLLGLAWTGEKDRTIAEFERLLHVPFGANIYFGRAGFRPLRDDPRFQKLVNDPRNNDPIY